MTSRQNCDHRFPPHTRYNSRVSPSYSPRPFIEGAQKICSADEHACWVSLCMRVVECQAAPVLNVTRRPKQNVDFLPIIWPLVQVSCSESTSVEVEEGISVEITSAQAATKLENVRFQLAEKAEFVSSVPALEWASGQIVSLVRA